jgi:hypothetical protein
MFETTAILDSAALCAVLGYLLGLLQRPVRKAGAISPVAKEPGAVAALTSPFLGACLVCGLMCPAALKRSIDGGFHVLAHCELDGGSVWPLVVQL